MLLRGEDSIYDTISQVVDSFWTFKVNYEDN